MQSYARSSVRRNHTPHHSHTFVIAQELARRSKLAIQSSKLARCGRGECHTNHPIRGPEIISRDPLCEAAKEKRRGPSRRNRITRRVDVGPFSWREVSAIRKYFSLRNMYLFARMMTR